MTVAAKLHAHARNWAAAYELLRRVHAYDFAPAIGVDHDDVARLAAIETALAECAQLGAEEIVVGETIPDHVLTPMRPIEGTTLVRAPAGEGRRAWFQVGPADAAAL